MVTQKPFPIHHQTANHQYPPQPLLQTHNLPPFLLIQPQNNHPDRIRMTQIISIGIIITITINNSIIIVTNITIRINKMDIINTITMEITIIIITMIIHEIIITIIDALIIITEVDDVDEVEEDIIEICIMMMMDHNIQDHLVMVVINGIIEIIIIDTIDKDHIEEAIITVIMDHQDIIEIVDIIIIEIIIIIMAIIIITVKMRMDLTIITILIYGINQQ
mmetsp:Transcript_34647/g.30453  ORF Transcript_34647/g.30453 Transcript_34647/m.30453 type:complete len:220 (+) Transcript_34647:368-1027(+)